MSHATDATRRAERLAALGAAIRAARGDRPQAAIALQLGRPQSSISSWESGTVDLSVERIRRLESALGIAHGSLLRSAGYIDDQVPWWVDCGEPHEDGRHFANNLLAWLTEHGHLLETAIELRSWGEHEALAHLLETKALTMIRTSWVLWRSISQDCDEILATVLSDEALDAAHLALWGPTAPAPSRGGLPHLTTP